MLVALPAGPLVALPAGPLVALPAGPAGAWELVIGGSCGKVWAPFSLAAGGTRPLRRIQLCCRLLQRLVCRRHGVTAPVEATVGAAPQTDRAQAQSFSPKRNHFRPSALNLAQAPSGLPIFTGPYPGMPKLPVRT